MKFEKSSKSLFQERVEAKQRGSNPARTRLYLLFGMLLLVVLLMNEAGKPKYWAWLIEFGRSGKVAQSQTENSQKNSDANSVDEQSATLKSRDVIFRSNATAATPVAQQDAAFEEIGTEDQLSPEPGASTDSPHQSPNLDDEVLFANGYPKAAAQFWRDTYLKLPEKHRTSLMQLISHIRKMKPIPEEERSQYNPLVNWLKKERAEYQQLLFSKQATISDHSPDKQEKTEEYFQSEEIWQEKIYPCFYAILKGKDYSMGQHLAVTRLQECLDSVVFSFVEDQQAIGWTGDKEGWIRIWELSQTNPPQGLERSNKRVELMSRPTVFRGKPVRIEGWVRGARTRPLSEKTRLPMEQDHYYSLWVRSADTKVGPINVYTAALPEGFPEVTDQFSKLNTQVLIEGYFFKVRRYIDTENSVQNCPVVIGSRLKIIEPVEHTSVNFWQPSMTTLYAIFACLPFLAIGLAWWAFRSAEHRPRVTHSDPQQQQRVNDRLADLSSDPAILSTRESLERLSDEMRVTNEPEPPEPKTATDDSDFNHTPERDEA